MQQKKPFKQPPKKFQPRGIKILHEDWDLLVIDKSAGMLSVSNEEGVESAQSLLNDYVKKGNSKSKNRVFVIHPLEKEVSGILVFAKTEAAKDFLMDKWNDFKKQFVAVVNGVMETEKGVVTSYLTENSIHKVYSVSDPAEGVFARTGYQLLKAAENFSLVEVNPMTGRKSQMRVHLSDEGHPVAGDKKYGTKGGLKRLCLHALSVDLMHPFSKEPLHIEAPMPGYFNAVLSRSN
ncbi:RluA family pseudouridine synthase [Pontiellaceae bacterium B12227]|nr:RluA family pseudouridine synthase [Pontiellaceae bacterium B12227]